MSGTIRFSVWGELARTALIAALMVPAWAVWGFSSSLWVGLAYVVGHVVGIVDSRRPVK